MTKNGVFQSFFHNNGPKMTIDSEYLESIPKYEFGLWNEQYIPCTSREPPISRFSAMKNGQKIGFFGISQEPRVKNLPDYLPNTPLHAVVNPTGAYWVKPDGSWEPAGSPQSQILACCWFDNGWLLIALDLDQRTPEPAQHVKCLPLGTYYMHISPPIPPPWHSAGNTTINGSGNFFHFWRARAQSQPQLIRDAHARPCAMARSNVCHISPVGQVWGNHGTELTMCQKTRKNARGLGANLLFSRRKGGDHEIIFLFLTHQTFLRLTSVPCQHTQ